MNTVENFVKNCILFKKNQLKDWKIEEMNKISSEKFEKLWNFYQPKINK